MTNQDFCGKFGQKMNLNKKLVVFTFDTYDNAQQYLNMHRTRLNSMGVSKVNAKYFDINKGLTTITNGRID